jgi:hypothetical protein
MVRQTTLLLPLTRVSGSSRPSLYRQWFQDVQLAGNRNTRSEQVPDRTRDIRGLHVFAANVVLTDQQNARARSALRLPIVVQVSEVLRITDAARPTSAYGGLVMRV